MCSGHGNALFHDVEHPKEEAVALGAGPNGEMGDFETRKLWAAVAKGIRDGDFETASKEKAKIEVSDTPCTYFPCVHSFLERTAPAPQR